MALVLKDRVRETTTTTGTGTVTLAGAVTGFQAFSVIGNGNSCYYCIADRSGANWEVGIGTYNSVGNTLARNTVLSSSNSGALVSFGAGTKDVFVTQPSEKAVYLDTNNFVGIGIATPNYPLEVRTASDTYGIAHSDVGGRIFSTYIGASGVYIGSDSNDPLILKTFDTEQMRIDTAGNVGIGTNSPTVKLDVNGAITGTTITAKTSSIIGDAANPSGIYGSLTVEDWSGSGLDYYLTLKSTDGTYNYPIAISDGAYVFNGFGVYNDFTSYGTSWLQYGVTIGVSGTSTASMQLNSIGGGFITLTVPTALSTNYTLTLPSTAGSANQVLKTDGTGVTDWTSAITLNGISDPSAPTGTNTTVYSKSFGGYPTLAARNALNTSFGLQSALWSKNIQMWTTTTATAGSWLNASGTGNGSFFNQNPIAGGTLYQTCRRGTYSNAITTVNQTLGVLGGQASFFRGSVAGQGGYFFYARCGFDVWTNGGRFFAGLSQAATVVTANATGTNNTAGFAVEDTDAGAISFVTRSGTTATKTSVGLTITSNKGYDCYIYCSPASSQISWQIIDINTGTSVTGTATTNLPTNTFMVNPMVLASNAALTAAAAINLGVSKIYVESDY